MIKMQFRTLQSISGLLIFRVVTQNSQKHAKYREIRQLIKYMSVQQFWKLLGVFTCHKLANLCQNFVTEMCKQCPKTTRRTLCYEKLGTSHYVKGFAIGSFLERVVVERANDDLCQKNIKNAGLISAKPIDFQRNLP